MRLRWAAALLTAFLATAPLAAPASAATVEFAASSVRADACADSTGVTVVVDFAELGGGVLVACASGLTAASRGSDALAAAGISWSPPASQPGFVCRLAGRPSADETFGTVNSDDYSEDCVDTPPSDAHWSYWQSGGDGTWSYSTSGVTSSRVKPGGFEGWSFSTGALLPPDYNPIGGDDPEPLPQPEPLPPAQPEPQPEPQPEQPAAPAPGQQDAPEQPQPAAPEPAETSAAAPPPTSVVASSTAADATTSAPAETTAGTAPTSTPSRTSSTTTSTSTAAAVTALADPVADSGGSGWGWVLGGAALIAALVGASFVIVRHRRNG